MIALAVGGTLLPVWINQKPTTLHASPSADNRRCAALMHGAVQKVKEKGRKCTAKDYGAPNRRLIYAL